MKLLTGLALALTVATVAGCKSNNDLQKQFVLRTSSAAGCGPAAAARVEVELAAVETLRRGHERFVIRGASKANSTKATVLNRADADAYEAADVYGNSVNGSTLAYFGNQRVLLSGAHESHMYVHMLTPRDPGYDTAIRAKEVLGENWEEITRTGIRSCN